MGFLDVPLDARFPGVADPARFCSHGEVLRYLEAYAARFDILRHCRLATVVRRAEPAPGDGGAARWRVATAPADTPDGQEPRVEFFDALVAANGHFSVPRLPPPYPGADAFPGLLMHAHNYRRPEPFVGKSVVLVGAAFSGSDIAQELLDAGAARVTLSARDWGDFAPGAVAGALRRAAGVAALHADGSVEFVDGSVAAAVDVLIFCTGYVYNFDFLVEGTLEVDDNRVVGVYKDVWPLLGAGAPPLSLIGLPWRVAPFPQVQLQSRWAARVLAGRFALPPADEMAADVARQYAEMKAANVPKRYTHRQGVDVQRAYNEFLVAACRDPGEPGWPLWRSELHSAVGASRRAHGAPFRDRPIVGGDEWLAAAAAEFAALHAAAAAAQ
jgi:cation diffusion facilitator CzcD-associated flavoprotein CzcO